MKITYINIGVDEDVQKNRVGFIPVCRYGLGITPRLNEIGCIGIEHGTPRYERGLYVTSFKCIERIFLKD